MNSWRHSIASNPFQVPIERLYPTQTTQKTCLTTSMRGKYSIFSFFCFSHLIIWSTSTVTSNPSDELVERNDESSLAAGRKFWRQSTRVTKPFNSYTGLLCYYCMKTAFNNTLGLMWTLGFLLLFNWISTECWLAISFPWIPSSQSLKLKLLYTGRQIKTEQPKDTTVYIILLLSVSHILPEETTKRGFRSCVKNDLPGHLRCGGKPKRIRQHFKWSLSIDFQPCTSR